MKLSTEGLAYASARRPWTIVAIWAAAVVVAGAVIAVYLESALTANDYFTSEPESERGWRLLRERRFELSPSPSEFVIVRSDTHTVDEGVFQETVVALFQELTAGEPVLGFGGVHYYETGQDSLVSEDGHTAIIPFMALRDIEAVRELMDRTSEESGFQIIATGSRSFDQDFEEMSKEDLEVEFKIGIPAAIVILVLVFGALLASVVPIVMALVSIVVALGITALIGQAFTFSFFVTNMIAMMGLAVGVDYSLFIVSRYREERRLGLERLEAISAAGSTASRSVFFSGVTVVLALLGMLVVPHSIFRSLAAGAIAVVTVAILTSLTLLPALLALMGDRVNALRVPVLGTRSMGAQQGRGGVWDAVSRAVMKRPLVGLVATAAILLAAATPYLGINLGFPAISTFPQGTQSRDGFEILDREFSFGSVSPVFILVDGEVATEAVRRAMGDLVERLRGDPDFGEPTVATRPDSDLAVITVSLEGDPNADGPVVAVRRLRDLYVPDAFQGVPAEVTTTGETAGTVDWLDMVNLYLPLVVAIVLALSFALLTVVFRSLVVPVKAIIMNLLSVGAAYGLMVLVFQRGFLAEVLGFDRVDAIAAWIPLFLFSVLFGLSMDYHVFLLSRIRERYDQTHDNTEAVAYGIRSTGGLITGAALIMVAVFSGFAMGKLVMFQQVGFGLAVAVLLDATIVRSVLVPSSMKLLGTRNWYLPSFLSWLPEVRVETPEAPAKGATSGLS